MKDEPKNSVPPWVAGAVIILAVVGALLFGLPKVLDPPPAKSFNELPLEERKRAVEGMLPRGQRPGPPGQTPP
jgi:hypothetical protein